MRRLVPVLVALALAATACSGDEPPSRTEPTPGATPLADYDTSAVVVARSAFCDRISDDAVRDALGDAAQSTEVWDDGETLRLPDGVEDVVHEFGCRFETSDGLSATAWLFAPPVTRARARELVRDAPGCWRAGGAGFGEPSAATRCVNDGQVEIGHRGLFGDAWLSCSVGAAAREEPDDLPERADRWCVQVLESVRVR